MPLNGRIIGEAEDDREWQPDQQVQPDRPAIVHLDDQRAADTTMKPTSSTMNATGPSPLSCADEISPQASQHGGDREKALEQPAVPATGTTAGQSRRRRAMSADSLTRRPGWW